MKIVTSKEMALIESKSYRDGSKEEDFMEAAGRGLSVWVDNFVKRENRSLKVTLLCGKGNNAGDAYVAGVCLLRKGYKVSSYQISPIEGASPLCRRNYARFLEAGGIAVNFSSIDNVLFDADCVLVDALFGTGFRGKAAGAYADFINRANSSGLPIIAVDIPSGLNGDSGIIEGVAIKARETVFLGLPKAGFFLQDGWKVVGKLRYVDFGLPVRYVDEFSSDMDMLADDMVKGILPQIAYDRHKYQAGLVVGLAGSVGMPGAAMLSSKAALRGGAGIVRLLHPKGMEGELTASLYELIRIGYGDGQMVIDHLNNAGAAFIGPGIGRGKAVRDLLRRVLPEIVKPCVIDADALTLIAEENIPIPKRAVLTPHKGEMLRLLGKISPKQGSWDFLRVCQEFAARRETILILKGGPTFIFQPDGKPIVSPLGDPGMATAGSGDVLTGLIAALIAEGVALFEAALLGVYIHGKAGEFAARDKSSYCMIAGDIIDCFPEAFRLLR